MKRTLITGLLAIAPLVASAATAPNAMDQERQQINKIIQKLDIHVGRTPKQQAKNLAKMNGWLHEMSAQERSSLLKALSSLDSHDLQPLKDTYRLALVADDMNKKAKPDFSGIEDTEIDPHTGVTNTVVTSVNTQPVLEAQADSILQEYQQAQSRSNVALTTISPMDITESNCSGVDLLVGGCQSVNGQALIDQVHRLTEKDVFLAYSLALQSISPGYYHAIINDESLRLAIQQRLESKKQTQLLQKIEHNQEALIDLLKHQQAV